jgi:hypothetical protein
MPSKLRTKVIQLPTGDTATVRQLNLKESFDIQEITSPLDRIRFIVMHGLVAPVVESAEDVDGMSPEDATSIVNAVESLMPRPKNSTPSPAE